MKPITMTTLVTLMTFACGGAPQESDSGSNTQELSGNTGNTLLDDVNYDSEPPPGVTGDPLACPDSAFETCTIQNGDAVTLDGECLQRHCDKKTEVRGTEVIADLPPASEPPPGADSKPKYCPASAFQACTVTQGDSKSGTSRLDKSCLYEKCGLKMKPLAQ